MRKEYASFSEFYPGYLAEHQNPMTRRLHVVGSALVLVALVAAVLLRSWWVLLLVPVIGYGFAWIAHVFFERNRPATFSHPLYSFVGDWVMFRDVVAGRIRW